VNIQLPGWSTKSSEALMSATTKVVNFIGAVIPGVSPRQIDTEMQRGQKSLKVTLTMRGFPSKRAVELAISRLQRAMRGKLHGLHVGNVLSKTGLITKLPHCRLNMEAISKLKPSFSSAAASGGAVPLPPISQRVIFARFEPFGRALKGKAAIETRARL